MTAASFAYQRGRRDGGVSLSPGCNPYPAGSAEHLDWQRGVQDAHERAFRCADVRRDERRPEQDLDIFGRPLRFGS